MMFEAVVSFTSEGNQVQADVVAVERLPLYLANLHGREKISVYPKTWETDDSPGTRFTVTEYLVVSWKCRG